MDNEAKKKITKARTALLLDNPFFGTLTLRLKTEERLDLPTAATDGQALYYNPAFINKMNSEELKAVLAHEVMHVALLHHTRRENRDMRKWNVAADFAINPILQKSGFTLPDGALSDPKFLDLTAEQIYNMIPDPPQQKGKGKGPGEGPGGQPGPGQDGMPGEGNDPGGMGGVQDAPDDGSGSGKAKAEEDAKIATQQAAQAARAMGSIPGGLKRMIDEIVNPLIPWREILHRFIKSAAKSDYTWTRPNRRYVSQGIYLPSLYSEQLDSVILAIDTSGSIDRDALNQFASELSAILDYINTELTVIYCDSKVQRVDHYTKADLPLELKPHGGGGTDFTPVFNYIAKHNLQPSVMIYLTDLECYRFPSEPDYPVLWACYGGFGEKPPFGEVMRIK